MSFRLCLAVVAAIAVARVAVVAAQAGVDDGIDQLCDGLAPLTKDKRKRQLFGLYQSTPESPGTWRSYKPRKLEAAVQNRRVFEVAQFWRRQDGAAALSLVLSSDSGDWAHFVEYCFRPDGTLARTESTLNTFLVEGGDGVSRVRKRSYDAAGKLIGTKMETFDLETRKPADRRFTDLEEPTFWKIADLPFFALLREVAPQSPASTGAE